MAHLSLIITLGYHLLSKIANDDVFVKGLFETLGNEEKKCHPFLWRVFQDAPTYLNEILAICLDCKNFNLQIAAILLSIEINNSDHIAKLRQSNLLFKNKLVNQISSSKIGDIVEFNKAVHLNLNNIENKLFAKQMVTQINKWFMCNLGKYNKIGYWNLYVNGKRGSVRIIPTEIVTEDLHENMLMKLRLLRVDVKQCILFFSEKKVSNIESSNGISPQNIYELEKMHKLEALLSNVSTPVGKLNKPIDRLSRTKSLNNLRIDNDNVGKVVQLTVVGCDKYFLYIQTEDKKNGRAHISNVSNKFIIDLPSVFPIGTKLIGTILSVNNTFGYDITLKKQNLKAVNNNSNSAKTLISVRLEAALAKSKRR